MEHRGSPHDRGRPVAAGPCARKQAARAMSVWLSLHRRKLHPKPSQKSCQGQRGGDIGTPFKSTEQIPRATPRTCTTPPPKHSPTAHETNFATSASICGRNCKVIAWWCCGGEGGDTRVAGVQGVQGSKGATPQAYLSSYPPLSSPIVAK